MSYRTANNIGLRTGAILLLACATGSLIHIYWKIFHRQVTWALGSDLRAHLEKIENGLTNVVHPLFHGSVKFTATIFTHNDIALATEIVLLCYSILSGFFLYLAIKESAFGKMNTLLAWAGALCIMSLSAIWLPNFNKYLYLNTGSPTVLHNPTTIVAKPFAFATLLLFAKALSNLSSEKSCSAFRFSIAAMVFAALSGLAKPNFNLAFVFAAPLLLGIFCLRGKISLQEASYLSLPIVCAAIVLLAQYLMKYETDQAVTSGITMNFMAVAAKRSDNPLLSLLFFSGFPLIVMLFYPRVFNKPLFLIVFCCFAVSCLQYLLLAETGPRRWHGNFGWGRMIIGPMMFAVCLSEYFHHLRRTGSLWERGKAAIASAVLLAHLVSGFLYLRQLLTTSSYF